MTNIAKKSRVKKKIIFDTVAVIFIALTPFLYKIYDYLPVDPIATISFLGITIDNNGFADVSTYIWFLTVKIIPFLLLIIWFFTSKDWWYHILLIPIAMYAFQLFEAFYSDDDYVDTENVLWLLPVCMIVIPFVYLIRIKLYDKYVHGIDLESMEAELKALKEKHGISEVEDSFKNEEKSVSSETKEYQSFSELLDEKLSTQNLELLFKRFQYNLRNWLHLKF